MAERRFGGIFGAAALLAAWALLWAAGGSSAATPSTTPGHPEAPLPNLAEHVQDLEPLLKPILGKHKAPGLAAAVLRGRQVTALGAVGVRKFGSPEPMTSSDQVHLGSCTKAMTATLIGQLVDQKKLSWDTSMAEVFPKLADGMDPAAAKITVQQLLTHTSGLPGNLSWWLFAVGGKSMIEQRQAVVAQALHQPPATPAGFLYSNLGYVILGAVLEAKTGKPWEVLIKEQLFTPLGMTSAGFGSPGTQGKIDQPWGHVENGDTPVPAQFDNAPVLGPAGRVHCTLADWARFVALHMAASRGEPRLLSAATFTHLHTPLEKQDYMAGWIVSQRRWAGGPVLTHNGSNTMWFCVVWMAPKKDFAVLVACNAGGGDAAKECDETASAIISAGPPLVPGGG